MVKNHNEKMDVLYTRVVVPAALDNMEFLNSWGFTATECCLCGLSIRNTQGRLLQCARCKIAHYCGMTCLQEDFAKHQIVCLIAAAQYASSQQQQQEQAVAIVATDPRDNIREDGPRLETKRADPGKSNSAKRTKGKTKKKKTAIAANLSDSLALAEEFTETNASETETETEATILPIIDRTSFDNNRGGVIKDDCESILPLKAHDCVIEEPLVSGGTNDTVDHLGKPGADRMPQNSSKATRKIVNVGKLADSDVAQNATQSVQHSCTDNATLSGPLHDDVPGLEVYNGQSEAPDDDDSCLETPNFQGSVPCHLCRSSPQNGGNDKHKLNESDVLSAVDATERVANHDHQCGKFDDKAVGKLKSDQYPQSSPTPAKRQAKVGKLAGCAVEAFDGMSPRSRNVPTLDCVNNDPEVLRKGTHDGNLENIKDRSHDCTASADDEKAVEDTGRHKKNVGKLPNIESQACNNHATVAGSYKLNNKPRARESNKIDHSIAKQRDHEKVVDQKIRCNLPISNDETTLYTVCIQGKNPHDTAVYGVGEDIRPASTSAVDDSNSVSKIGNLDSSAETKTKTQKTLASVGKLPGNRVSQFDESGKVPFSPHNASASNDRRPIATYPSSNSVDAEKPIPVGVDHDGNDSSDGNDGNDVGGLCEQLADDPDRNREISKHNECNSPSQRLIGKLQPFSPSVLSPTRFPLSTGKLPMNAMSAFESNNCGDRNPDILNRDHTGSPLRGRRDGQGYGWSLTTDPSEQEQSPVRSIKSPNRLSNHALEMFESHEKEHNNGTHLATVDHLSAEAIDCFEHPAPSPRRPLRSPGKLPSFCMKVFAARTPSQDKLPPAFSRLKVPASTQHRKWKIYHPKAKETSEANDSGEIIVKGSHCG